MKRLALVLALAACSEPAPSAGVRSRGPTIRRKVGSERATPGVSAQPGCMALTTILSFFQAFAHSSVTIISPRLALA